MEREMRLEFRKIGQIVATEARRQFTRGVARSGGVAKTAAGFYPVVRLRGVEVDQRLRKTTGKRSDWGAKQMRRGLLPALNEKQGEIRGAIESAVDKATRRAGF